jgi:hypothetical protein
MSEVEVTETTEVKEVKEKETVQKAVSRVLGISPESLETFFSGVPTPEEKELQEEIEKGKLQEANGDLSPKGIAALKAKEDSLQLLWLTMEEQKKGMEEKIGLAFVSFYRSQYTKKHDKK